MPETGPAVTILVIEDDSSVLSLVERRLTAKGAPCLPPVLHKPFNADELFRTIDEL